jgi:hypothetical protein
MLSSSIDQHQQCTCPASVFTSRKTAAESSSIQQHASLLHRQKRESDEQFHQLSSKCHLHNNSNNNLSNNRIHSSSSASNLEMLQIPSPPFSHRENLFDYKSNLHSQSHSPMLDIDYHLQNNNSNNNNQSSNNFIMKGHPPDTSFATLPIAITAAKTGQHLVQPSSFSISLPPPQQQRKRTGAQLLTLPNELLHEILSCLKSPKDLANCAIVCKKLTFVALGFLYAKPSISSIGQLDRLMATLDTSSRRPMLSSSSSSLSFSLPTASRNDDDVVQLQVSLDLRRFSTNFLVADH